MKPRTLLILSVVALLALGAGVWIASRDASSSREAQALYPDLSKQLDSINAVRIFKAGDVRAVELVRTQAGWGVTERNGYAADESKLRKLVRGIAEAKQFEEKTANPENYKSLGVEDVSQADATGVRIELEGPASAVNLIVGKAAVGGNQYVRRAQEAQSWLITESLEAADAPDDWLRKEIVDISADRIQSINVKVAKQKPYTAAKNSRADEAFAVNDVPKGKSLSSPSAANGFATALASLTLTDVHPAADFAEPPASTATFKTFDGLVVELEGWTRGDKRYVRVNTSFDQSHAERFAAPSGEAKNDSDKEQPDQKTEVKDQEVAKAPEKVTPATSVAEEAKKTSARTQGWVYELPNYRYDQIFKPIEQLLTS